MRASSCCVAWSRRFAAARFATTLHEVDDLDPACLADGVPDDLAGCHTAGVADYVVEGHVLLAAVQRMLAERPAIRGLAVPEKPLGSPGMEVDGQPPNPYDVLAFAADGGRSVFLAVRP